VIPGILALLAYVDEQKWFPMVELGFDGIDCNFADALSGIFDQG
jgi:hypothetical protein